MLKTRIIPTLLWKDVGLVKGIGFDSTRRVGSILPAIKVYNTRLVDELILLDITATHKKQSPDFETVTEMARECFCPLTVGGGIKSVDDVKKLLRAGADKISVNSSIFSHPKLISDIANQFGSQCIVVSIDAKKDKRGEYWCYSQCGTKLTGKTVKEWVVEATLHGAGEILITSIVNDGTMKGYDLELVKTVTKNTNIPVIAAGGAGNYEDFYQAIKIGGASAVAAASIFHFTQLTPIEAKKYLKSKNIPVRNTSLD